MSSKTSKGSLTKPFSPSKHLSISFPPSSLQDKSMSPSRAREAAEQSRLLQDKLGDLELSTRTLQRLVKSLQKHELKVQHIHEQQEMMLQRLIDAESMVSVLRGQLEDKDVLAKHSQQLHNQLGQSEVEAQQLSIRVQVCVWGGRGVMVKICEDSVFSDCLMSIFLAQSLTEKLHQKELECIQLEGKLREAKRNAQMEKEVLKKATKSVQESRI